MRATLNKESLATEICSYCARPCGKLVIWMLSPCSPGL